MTHLQSDSIKKHSRRDFFRLVFYSGLGLTGSVAYAHSDNLEIVKQVVPVKGLPASLDGFTIGVLADFHAGAWGNEGVIIESIDAMQRLRPDVIALLGDYVDGVKSRDGHNIEQGMFVFKALQTLKAPFGIYAVLGNHDYWVDCDRVTGLLVKSGVTVLNNENRELPNGLVLAGVEDYWEGSGNPGKALNGSKGKTVILLSHNPDINEVLDGYTDVQLVISGHTHGGQIRAPLVNWSPWVPCSKRYRGATGLLRESSGRLCFISKGIGSFLVPARLFCPPDISLLTLMRI